MKNGFPKHKIVISLGYENQKCLKALIDLVIKLWKKKIEPSFAEDCTREKGGGQPKKNEGKGGGVGRKN